MAAGGSHINKNIMITASPCCDCDGARGSSSQGVSRANNHGQVK